MRSHGNLLELECGNPQEKPATFSRFVFPFAYSPKDTEKSKAESAKEKSTLHYVDCSVPELSKSKDHLVESRKDYFTYETAEVLFESAKWLEMEKRGWEGASWKNVTLYCRGKEINVAMLPPRLVLFEWPFKKNRKCSQVSKASEILRTGFLMVDLYFHDPENDVDKPELDDLLLINDFFRFFRCPYDTHAEQFGELLSEVPIDYDTSDPRKVGNPAVSSEDAYLHRWTNLLKFQAKVDGQAFELFSAPNANLPYADNRAYVWSAAILKDGAGALQKAFSSSDWQAHHYGHWIKFLNVDSPDTKSYCPSKTHRNVKQFEKAWAEERTYHRWEEDGTWYGFNYHSGVMLGPPMDESSIPVWRHFRQMYFDIALLMFYVRVSLFRFSRYLTEIAPRSGEYDKAKKEDFSRLRGLFSVFTIRYQFPLLSNQQQAVEMYTLTRQQFDIEELYAEVKEEIDNTNEFLEARDQGKISGDAYRLARFGIPLAVGALIASVFGMNAGYYPFLKWIKLFWMNRFAGITLGSTSVSFITLLVIVVVPIIFLFFLLRNNRNHINRRKG